MGRQRARVALTAFAALAIALHGAAQARADEMTRGRELFALCSQCHGNDAGGMQLALAPSIAGLGSWYLSAQLNKFKDGQRAATFDDLHGMRMRGMARWLKTDDDVKAAAVYVAALPVVKPAPTLTGGDATRGAALYATCSGCHGAHAEGVEAVGGPALYHASDWYLYSSLQAYKAGVRGYDPRDATGAAMRGMANLLVDDQAIKDVIAYIVTLSPPPASAGAE